MFLLLHIFFISFTDKFGSQPITFSDRAIEQRALWNIPTDSLDYAVSPLYLDSLRRVGGHIYHTSRWMNGATVELTPAVAEQVATWTFVRSVDLTKDDTPPSSVLQRKLPSSTPSQQNVVDYTRNQLALYNLLPLHAAGHKGQDIVMTICDAGFTKTDEMTCFDHSHCLGTYDFSAENKGFYASSTHGTNCLSVIAAETEDYHGAAPEAHYYLMRSEENDAESPKESDNLIAALEKADSLGTNIFSASLGYYNFDNPAFNWHYTDMDGQTTRCSRAATIAARKGMLVVIAMGNEGNKSWHYLTAPADADSILAVGAVGIDSVLAPFSSRGYSSDGRVKPEACAVGYQTFLYSPSGIVSGNGTSFATPLLAGMAASLWSAMPTATAQDIRSRIIRSAHLYTQPNPDYGYGIPNAEAAWRGTTNLSSISESTPTPTPAPRKFLFHSQLLIEYNGTNYNILGQKQ